MQRSKNTNKTTLRSEWRSALKKDLTGPTLLEMSDKDGAFDRSMQHHLRTDLFKGGVYDPRNAIETFFHAENRNLEPVEVRAVVA
jgi:hypothetical protein